LPKTSRLTGTRQWGVHEAPEATSTAGALHFLLFEFPSLEASLGSVLPPALRNFFLRKPAAARESICMKTMPLAKMIWLAAAVLWQAAIAAMAGVNSEMKLASSAAGRVVLHLLCARRDHHYRWHWQGVRREFARN